MPGLGVELTGDWRRALEILRRIEQQAGKALERAVLQEAHEIRSDIVKGLDSGKGFAPHSSATLFLRRATGNGKGSKILIASTTMRSAITVLPIPGGGAFVGVARSAKGGRFRIAQIQEQGANIRKTAKMMRFLFAMLRRAGAPRQPSRGTAKVTIRIPPRPFIGPVVSALKNSGRLEKRILARVKQELGL